MKPVLVLVDLQNDFLSAPRLEPAAEEIVERAARLLAEARVLGVPVVHVRTTVNPTHHDTDTRMPHWKKAGKWSCVAGTSGHEVPAELQPQEGEPIVDKTFFSGFETGALDEILKSLAADTLVFAGVHLHGCIRASVLDAYRRGFQIIVADDATGSDDPLHAAITRRYLESRAAQFFSVREIMSLLQQKQSQAETTVLVLPAAIIADEEIRAKVSAEYSHLSPRDRKPLWTMASASSQHIADATHAAQAAQQQWQQAPIAQRAELLERIVGVLASRRESLARQMALEIGKPITHGRAEVGRACDLLRASAAREEDLEELACGNAIQRRRPLGTVAMITPWNNPVAIPLGKIGPALFYGNGVVWKPAPAASSLALAIMEILREADCPPGLVNLVCGDRNTAFALMNDARVDAVTLTGAPAAGYAATEICARRHVPLQTELGGNNAAIVWRDADLKTAAAKIAEAAFGFAGQRCTANRRAIVDAACYDEFLNLLEAATANLIVGDPLDETTQVGPLVSVQAAIRVSTLLSRTAAAALRISVPHGEYSLAKPTAHFLPTIVCGDDENAEIVQQESFGPVLVVQRAQSWNHALELCNGVRQGLAAALFSSNENLQRDFLDIARAGILKINAATADANALAPFGGWKASGSGPPEHGESNREFYTRAQAVYNASAQNQQT